MEEQDVFVSSRCGAVGTAAAPTADCCWAKQRCADLSGGRRHQRKVRNGRQSSAINEDTKMLAPPGPKVMDRLSREMGMRRDHQVRLHSNRTDWKLDLPPNIALPDGEEVPYGSSTRLQIRDSEQESEIYQKCVRPPPNRTVFDGESPPPYRTGSACVLGSGDPEDWSSVGSSSTRVMRCNSVSSGSCSSWSTNSPSVNVPSGPRHLSAFSDSSGGGALADLTMLPCSAEESHVPKPPPSQHGAV